MNYSDKILTCADCGKEFVFTAGEQEFFEQKGFSNLPKRCTDCKARKKAQSGYDQRPNPRAGRSKPDSARQKFPATCSQCGTAFDAPFLPDPNRAVFCRNCFKGAKKR
ncbi:MAG: zinc-ribbon domain containing protein [Deltaproteobacteria bacterium]|nr:zinc-ribbon domain containing protein [Deltaproteobacteria bacterium]